MAALDWGVHMKPQVQPDYWRDRAEEARTAADSMSDAVARNMMYYLADSYDYMARQAEARTKKADGDLSRG